MKTKRIHPLKDVIRAQLIETGAPEDVIRNITSKPTLAECVEACLSYYKFLGVVKVPYNDVFTSK